MRFVFIGLNYAPEPIGVGPYTRDLAEYCAARGHDVTVLAGNPYYPDWERFDGFPDAVSRRVENGVTVLRVPHYVPANPTGARRLVHHVSFARNAARVARRIDDADIVISLAPSLVSASVALKLARHTGAVSWLHIQDFEVEAALATGLLGRWPLGMIAKRFERSMIKRFDWVSSISGAMVKQAIAKGAQAAQTIEHRNWSDSDLASSASGIADLRTDLNLGEGNVVLYSGNVARKQGATIIIEAARLLEHRKDIQFLVCGAGSAWPDFEAEAVGLPNLHLRGLQPRGRLGDLLGLADVHLLTQVQEAADLVLPSKLTNMLASGRPVVATAAAGTALAEEVAGCGIVCEPGDAESFAHAIERLIDDRDLRLALGKSAAERASERWSAPVLLEQFAVSLEQAIAAKEMR